MAKTKTRNVENSEFRAYSERNPEADSGSLEKSSTSIHGFDEVIEEFAAQAVRISAPSKLPQPMGNIIPDLSDTEGALVPLDVRQSVGTK